MQQLGIKVGGHRVSCQDWKFEAPALNEARGPEEHPCPFNPLPSVKGHTYLPHADFPSEAHNTETI